ncbi:MAG: hypothetical protein WEA77_06760 [Hyphomonas sp.]|uniref:hypothetical protein n=1 Tax=Hyphomonas sp. TaxID=87 RepID=UPI0034A09576
MKLVKAFGIGIFVLGLVSGLAWQFFLKDQIAFARIASAYGAKMVCSCRFVAGRPMESCLTDFTADLSQITFKEQGDTVRASVLGGLISSQARNTGHQTGCTMVDK